MYKLAVIYNVFGASGRDNSIYYMDALRTLFRQQLYDEGSVKIVVSGCAISQGVKSLLMGEFPRASFNWIDRVHPVNQTFNHTVGKVRDHFGPVEAFVYVDSGVNFHNLPLGLTHLYETFKSGPYAMVAADPNNDRGYEWCGVHRMAGPVVDFEVGWAMCAHANLYSAELLDTYGRMIPDVFQNDTSESVHTFLCAAIKKRFALDKRVTVFHNHNMDGGNAFRGKPCLFNGRDIKSIALEGRKYGLGWEECQPHVGVLHDPALFDKDGFALLPVELQAFIKTNLFLQPHEFDYGSIQSQWVAR